jgi:hypothetical protein
MLSARDPTSRMRNRHYGLAELAEVVPLRPESLSQDSEGGTRPCASSIGSTPTWCSST